MGITMTTTIVGIVHLSTLPTAISIGSILRPQGTVSAMTGIRPKTQTFPTAIIHLRGRGIVEIGIDIRRRTRVRCKASRRCGIIILVTLAQREDLRQLVTTASILLRVWRVRVLHLLLEFMAVIGRLVRR